MSVPNIQKQINEILQQIKQFEKQIETIKNMPTATDLERSRKQVQAVKLHASVLKHLTVDYRKAKEDLKTEFETLLKTIKLLYKLIF
jgi:hypothetical protein